MLAHQVQRPNKGVSGKDDPRVPGLSGHVPQTTGAFDVTADNWQGRTVIVTGATKGIGRATALLFGAAGAHVMVHGRSESAALEVRKDILASGGDATIVLSDLREPEAANDVVRAAVSATGRLDVLVNNAGANVFAGVLKATLADWDDCLNLDLRAVWLCSRAAALRMKPGSAIVNVSSNHSTSTIPGAFPYNVAKAGVNALTQSLTIELAAHGIRVNTVVPGYIDTPINDAYFATFDDPQAARTAAERLHPLGHLGAAVDVAHAIEFLADSTRSAFTTGSLLTLDGGRSALLQDPNQP